MFVVAVGAHRHLWPRSCAQRVKTFVTYRCKSIVYIYPMHTLPCARSAPKFSLHIAADFRPPVTPSVQIFTLRYENLFCPESVTVSAGFQILTDNTAYDPTGRSDLSAPDSLPGGASTLGKRAVRSGVQVRSGAPPRGWAFARDAC